MHDDVARAWTMTQLARTAALSRSAFFDRFTRTVGYRQRNTCSPGAWRSPRTCSANATYPHRGRATCRLQLGEYLQHSIQAPRRPTAKPLRTRGLTLTDRTRTHTVRHAIAAQGLTAGNLAALPTSAPNTEAGHPIPCNNLVHLGHRGRLAGISDCATRVPERCPGPIRSSESSGLIGSSAPGRTLPRHR